MGGVDLRWRRINNLGGPMPRPPAAMVSAGQTNTKQLSDQQKGLLGQGASLRSSLRCSEESKSVWRAKRVQSTKRGKSETLSANTF
jgi:hypothetical protein